MKLFALLIALTAVLGCSTAEKKTAADESEQLLTQASRKIVQDFSTQLKQELLAALNSGGPAAAIPICEKRAPEIAAAHFATGQVTVRRITDRNRNPENLADSTQMEVLAQMSADSALDEYYGWQDTEDGRRFSFYKAIHVNQLCLQCHGSTEIIDPSVIEALTTSYPGDRAVEYNVGDFRGAFLVQIEWPAGKEYVEKLMHPQAEAAEETSDN